MATSTGLQCASFNCYSYSYNIIDHVRVLTKISFLCFPQEQSERNAWCNLIKRRENKDGFRISKSTRVCEKHFLPEKIYRPPGDTRKRLIQGGRSALHPQNNFTFIKKHRKELLRPSPRKNVRVADCSEQQYDVQQDLFETDDNIQLDDSPVDFEKTTKGLTDNLRPMTLIILQKLSLKDRNIQLKS